MKENQPNLLRQDLLNVLHIDCQIIFTNSFVNYVEDKHMDLNKILEECKEVYRKIDVPGNAKPKYYNVFSVPYTLRMTYNVNEINL